MILKTTLDMLSDKSVSVKTQKYVEDGGVEYAVGEPHRRAFVNSERGRAELSEALASGLLGQNDYVAILAKWGPVPTVVETNG